MKKSIMMLLMTLMVSGAAYSQDEREGKLSVGINTGLKGFIGGDVAYAFTKRIGVRLGYHYMKVTMEGVGGTYGDTEILGDVTLKKQNIELLGDLGINPSGSIRFTTGFAIFIDDEISAIAYLEEGRQFNDIYIESEEIGEMTANVGHRSSIAPYLGFGFGKIIPTKRLNFSCDLGMYYTGKYAVSTSGTNAFEPNSSHGPVIEENLNRVGLKFWPVLNFRLAYRIL